MAIKVNDSVRVIDGQEVIEGQVTNVFESNGIDYVQVGAKVYAEDEVTKVPRKSIVEEATAPPAHREYVADLDDREDDVKSITTGELVVEDEVNNALKDVVDAVNHLIDVLTEDDANGIYIAD